MKSKKAQVSETITWISAFLIIFVIILLFVMASRLFLTPKFQILTEKTLNMARTKSITTIITNEPRITDANEMLDIKSREIEDELVDNLFSKSEAVKEIIQKEELA